jgi:hypothetical protein
VNEVSMNGRRRVVVTGIGAVSPLGNDVETTWKNLIGGESGAGTIQQFDASEYPVNFACELKEFDPATWIERKQARRMDRFAQMIVAAARQAEADSGIEIESQAARVGASVATGIGGLKAFQDCYDVLIDRGPDRVNPFSIPQIIPNMGAAWVSMELGTRGRSRRSAPPAPPPTWPSATRPTRSGSAAPTRCSPAAPRRGSRGSGSPVSAPCAPSRGGTRTPRRRHGRSTPPATAS